MTCQRSVYVFALGPRYLRRLGRTPSSFLNLFSPPQPGHVFSIWIMNEDDGGEPDETVPDESQEQRKDDFYKVLEVSYDASDESIRSNYLRLALKWHPDKHKGDDHATTKFQEISEAYRVLSDPVKRLEYDLRADMDVHQYTITEYLNRFKGLILTCSGLGIEIDPNGRLIQHL